MHPIVANRMSNVITYLLKEPREKHQEALDPVSETFKADLILIIPEPVSVF